MGLRARQAAAFQTVYNEDADTKYGKGLVARTVMKQKRGPMHHVEIDGVTTEVRVPTGGTNTPDPNKGISFTTPPSDATMKKRGFKWDSETEEWVKVEWTLKETGETFDNAKDYVAAYRAFKDAQQANRFAAHRAECDANRMLNGVPVNVPIGGLYAVAFDEDGNPTEWERCTAADVLPRLQGDSTPAFNRLPTPVEGGEE